jgi:hypothetical protein
MRIFPFADEAAPHQRRLGTLFEVQLLPAFVDVKIWPVPSTAKSLFPSAEEATPFHAESVMPVVVQEDPEVVEV